MNRGAFKQTPMSGAPFVDWLDKANRFHGTLMREAKLRAPAAGAAALPASTPMRK
jgi:hypothetical protein